MQQGPFGSCSEDLLCFRLRVLEDLDVLLGVDGTFVEVELGSALGGHARPELQLGRVCHLGDWGHIRGVFRPDSVVLGVGFLKERDLMLIGEESLLVLEREVFEEARCHLHPQLLVAGREPGLLLTFVGLQVCTPQDSPN